MDASFFGVSRFNNFLLKDTTIEERLIAITNSFFTNTPFKGRYCVWKHYRFKFRINLVEYDCNKQNEKIQILDQIGLQNIQPELTFNFMSMAAQKLTKTNIKTRKEYIIKLQPSYIAVIIVHILQHWKTQIVLKALTFDYNLLN